MTASAVDAAPCRIFISYRRDDSAGWAGRLASDLQERLGQQTVFQDVATIEAGEDFTAAITRVLQTCAVALVLIGPDWRDIRDEKGARLSKSRTTWCGWKSRPRSAARGCG
jgi:hypothetical protein